MMPNAEDIKIPAIFDQYPEVKSKIVAYLRDVPQEQKQKTYEDFFRFIDGELTWAEMNGISPKAQKVLARVAYMHFKRREYETAETMFRGLAMLDHSNWYFRAALGAVYQRQKRYEDAVQEYSAALDLKPGEPSALVNRGECLMMMRDFDGAESDLQKINRLGLDPGNKFFLRAQILKQRVKTARDLEVNK